MKRIITMLVIFAAFLFASEIMAQDATVARNGTNFNITLTAADTIGAVGTVAKTIGVGAKQSVQLYSIQVTIDSISGTPAETIILAGSMDNSVFTTISTVTWAGSSTDTTFHYTDLTTGVAWPYMKVSGSGTTGVGQVTTLRGRFFDEVR